MIQSNQVNPLFNNCEGLLTELSTADEAVLTGGTYYKRGFRGGSSSSGGGFKRGGSSSSGGFKRGGSSSGGFKGGGYGKGYYCYFH